MSAIIRSFFASALLCGALSASAQTQFTLSGKINDQADAPLILRYTNNAGKAVTDSVTVQNGSFTFNGDIDKAALVRLSVSRRSSKFKGGDDANTVEIFLEPGATTASCSYADLKDMKITGSASQTEFAQLDRELHTYYRTVDGLEAKFLALQDDYRRIMKINEDDPKLKIIDDKCDSLNGIMGAGRDRILNKFITTHPNSYVSAYEINDWKSRWSVRKVTQYYSSLTPRVLDCHDAKLVKGFLDKINANSTGKPAKNFATVDVNGKKVSLADFKGRYVILDFWAHWCVPCRASTPHLMELYNKYHNSGLDVIAIADDDNAQAEWKRAIKKDKIEPWVNILSGYDKDKENQNTTDISNKYSIIVMPTKILIDKNGLIVGRYAGTDEAKAMDKKLAEIFSK